MEQLRDQAAQFFRTLVGLKDDTPIIRAEFDPDRYSITYLTEVGERTDTVYWAQVAGLMTGARA